MSIHRISSVNKGKDEAYRQSYYKKLERSKTEIETSFSDDICEIRSASAELNRYATEFDMKSFGEVDLALNRIVERFNRSGINTSDVIQNYPSDDVVKLSKLG